jgi:phage terminase small subunit
MGVPKRLTEMQMRFAEYIVFGGPDGPVTQTEAATLAGYSKHNARHEGSSLLNPRHSPLVVQYVGKLKEERLEKHKVTYDTHVAELARIKELALKKNSFSAAVNAETNRGKAGGLYIDRKIIKHGKLEDMSEEELELKMKQILDDYAPILNVTPEAPSLEQKPLQTKKEKKEIKKESIESNQTLKTTSEKLQEELEPITSESHSEHTTSQEEK